MILLLLLFGGARGPVEIGPIPVVVDHVHDGDTIYVDIPGWPAVAGRGVGLRVHGVACPEMGDPNPEDHELAMDARDYVARRIKASKRVEAADVGRDKFGGRYQARVLIDGIDLGPELIKRGYAREWDGRGKQPYKEND